MQLRSRHSTNHRERKGVLCDARELCVCVCVCVYVTSAINGAWADFGSHLLAVRVFSRAGGREIGSGLHAFSRTANEVLEAAGAHILVTT